LTRNGDGIITQFMDRHYRHFNARVVREAADAYMDRLEQGDLMLLAMAGAMSTGEIGRSLAEMIRQDKVHAISCTAANLEEDIFNLVAHKHYRIIPNWRNLTVQQEKELELNGLNRVTDTCIPEEQAFRAIEFKILELWQRADRENKRYFPHEFMYQLIDEMLSEEDFHIDPKDSWLVAACEKKLPIFVPGWEDSTMGNVFVSHVLVGDVSGYHVVRSGLEYMGALADWYVSNTLGERLEAGKVKSRRIGAHADEAGPGGPGGDDAANEPGVLGRDVSGGASRDATHDATVKILRRIGFFQIGGGIAGDFPICVVPMIHQDLERPCPYWSYFCQIGDSTTSYGSYSGAIPSEKITWGKLDVDSPSFAIESDASIVAPLIFARILGW